MPHTPVILFDIMETLVVEPFFTAVPVYLGMPLQELLAAKHPTSWIDFEKGQITEDEYVDRFFVSGKRVDREGLRRCLSDAYRWVDGMQPILEELHSAGYEMHALSNYSTWYEMIEEKLELSRYLRWSFVSCMSGLRKPDEKAYQHATNTLNVPPDKCLFIDDRVVNVQAARAHEMDAILKQDASQVRAELCTRGLL